VSVDIDVVSVMAACAAITLTTSLHIWYIDTRYVILAKHLMWLPDDGFM